MRCPYCATRNDDGSIDQMGHHDTVAEARACKGVEDPKVVGKQRTYLRNAIRESGLTADHFSKKGLFHIAGVLGIEAKGTRKDLAAAIREVL